MRRPLGLFDDRPAVQRAVEPHTPPATGRKRTRRVRQQGPLGLFPEPTEIGSPSRGPPVPDDVVAELARLTARYAGGQLRELARIIQEKGPDSIEDKTVTKLWQQSPGPGPGELPFGTYHSHAQR